MDLNLDSIERSAHAVKSSSNCVMQVHEALHDFHVAVTADVVLALVAACRQGLIDAALVRESRKETLLDLMSRISDDCHFSSWWHNNEFRLWRAVVDPQDDLEYGNFGPIGEDDVALLRTLSEQVDGWWMCDHAAEKAFVPLAQWKEIYAAGSDHQKYPT